MREEERSFNLGIKKIEDLQEKVTNLLKNILDFKTTTEIYISYSDNKGDSEIQKNNKIVIHHDNDKLYVLVKGELSEIQNDIIWAQIEKYVKETESIVKDKEIDANKNEISQNMMERINKEGFVFNIDDAKKFINNFHKKFNRLPKIEEIQSIGLGYINMLNAEMVKNEDNNKVINDIGKNIDNLSNKEEASKIIQDFDIIKENQIKDNKGILEIQRPVGRRVCPKCGNQNISTIKEIVDKTVIISNYPRLFGKKYQCRLCNCEWREK